MNPSSDIQRQYNHNFHNDTGSVNNLAGVLNSVLNKVDINQYKDKISNKVIDPIAEMIGHRVRHYVHIGMGAYFMIIILLLIIIYLLVSKKK